MGETWRESMTWLHTWAGVLGSALLFAIFWMGTLSVYDREIDRWMMPATRLSPPPLSFSLDKARDALAAQTRGVADWALYLPTLREPAAWIVASDTNGVEKRTYLDPSTYAVLPDPGTWAGTEFLFPFHWHLHLRRGDVGLWLVGIAGMAMMMLLISGIIIHRHFFTQFFTFRAKRKTGRLVLDLHNLSGVLVVPFHIMITLSGLVIWFYIYFPGPLATLYEGDKTTFYEDTRGRYARPMANMPIAQQASLDAMVAEAKRRWGSGHPNVVHIWNNEDASFYVEIRRSFQNDIARDTRIVYFDGATGAVLRHEASPPIARVQRFISGLHWIEFTHWTLRWIYFLLGLAGCLLIVTGLLYWLEARKKRHGGRNFRGAVLVEGMTLGSTTGIVIATLAFFIVNRLLPLGIENRVALEIWTFYLIWFGTFVHGWMRPKVGWSEHAWAIAFCSYLAVILNAATTSDHPFKTLAAGEWAVGGMDVVLLLCGTIAAWAALRLQGRSLVSLAPTLART